MRLECCERNPAITRTIKIIAGMGACEQAARRREAVPVRPGKSGGGCFQRYHDTLTAAGAFRDAKCGECRRDGAFGAAQIGNQGGWQLRRRKQSGGRKIGEIVSRIVTVFGTDNRHLRESRKLFR